MFGTPGCVGLGTVVMIKGGSSAAGVRCSVMEVRTGILMGWPGLGGWEASTGVPHPSRSTGGGILLARLAMALLGERRRRRPRGCESLSYQT